MKLFRTAANHHILGSRNDHFISVPQGLATGGTGCGRSQQTSFKTKEMGHIGSGRMVHSFEKKRGFHAGKAFIPEMIGKETFTGLQTADRRPDHHPVATAAIFGFR